MKSLLRPRVAGGATPLLATLVLVAVALQSPGNAGCDEARVPMASTFVRRTTIISPDRALRDAFGFSTSIDGDTLVVGEPGDRSFRGAVQVFARSGGVWTHQAKVTVSDAAADDDFGRAADVSGDTLVVGARRHDGVAQDAGAAYVFHRAGGVWTLQQKLINPDPAVSAQFGSAVSIDGNTLVVGGLGYSPPGGRVYVYVWTGTIWTLQQRLVASDGTPLGSNTGTTVSVRGDTIGVGAPAGHGAIYVFTRSGATWSESQKVVASDDSYFGLGTAVAIDGDTLVGGAPYEGDRFASPGAAYVFVRSPSGWVQQQRLLASDVIAQDEFGNAVSISGDTIAVGAHYETHTQHYWAGAAYVFGRTGTLWSQTQKLISPIIDQPSLFFGHSLAVGPGTIVVGSPSEPIYYYADFGAVHAFQEPSADLRVSKTDGLGTILPGGALSYTIVVANDGPEDALGATVLDTLPPSLQCMTICAGVGGAVCTPGPFAGNINDVVSIPIGQSVVFSSNCTLSSSARGTLANTVTIKPPVSLPDFSLANNSASDLDAIVTNQRLFTVSPCRLVDTRGGEAVLGGPALEANISRTFALGGLCGIPTSAKSVSLNVVVTEPGGQGNLRLFPAGEPQPLASNLNYLVGQTRANSAVITLNPSAELAVLASQTAGTRVHLIVDVNGYFE